MIPLFIVEEHHEAFFIWHYARLKGLIEASGNTLLHVDQHADTVLPRLHTSLNSLPDDLEAYHRFTYSELCIGDFIPATLYQGLFKILYWVQHQKLKVSQTIHVYSHNQGGQALLMTGNIQEAGVFSPERKSVHYELKTINDELADKNAVVLDIDLDYFSCNRLHGVGELRSTKVEVTKAEFDKFTTNIYHPLRVSIGGVKAKTENGRYYLLVNDFPEVIPSKLKVSSEQILTRMEQFAEFLVANNIQPQLIDICRSRFSGFTAEDQWEFIENKLLEKLNTMYNLDIKPISAVLAQENLTLNG
ncbi:UPF0489 family protein [Chloroflexota bacterium]